MKLNEGFKVASSRTSQNGRLYQLIFCETELRTEHVLTVVADNVDELERRTQVILDLLFKNGL